jgi:phosphoribosylamine-glycine ligase
MYRLPSHASYKLRHSRVKQAQQKAYQIASPIAFDGLQMRQDIGYRAIKN